jgi:hypothetical protein
VGLRDVGVAAGGMGGEDMQVTGAKLLHLLYRAMVARGSREKGTKQATREDHERKPREKTRGDGGV